MKLSCLVSLDRKSTDFYEEVKCFEQKLLTRIKKYFCKYSSFKCYSLEVINMYGQKHKKIISIRCLYLKTLQVDIFLSFTVETHTYRYA